MTTMMYPLCPARTAVREEIDFGSGGGRVLGAAAEAKLGAIYDSSLLGLLCFAE